MRRLLLIAGVVGMSLTAVPVAQTAATVQVDCTAREYLFLFWPSGHGAISSVRFPVYRPPHIEMYAGLDRTFPPAAQVGFTGDGQLQIAPSCKRVRQQTGGIAAGRMSNALRTNGTIECRFPKPVQLQVRRPAYADSRRQMIFRVIMGRTIVLDALVLNASSAGTGSEGPNRPFVTFHPSHCKKTPAPS